MKRIIVACDGTWVDGTTLEKKWQYTNVLRLTRCILIEDKSISPPVDQVVFYQSGIGSEPNWYSYLQGYTGATLGEKVQEAYAFIATNYCPGDEIFLFGFSRGAYTARMVAMFIGAIGVLSKPDIDHFAEIFITFQKRGKTTDPKEITALDKQLEPWTRNDSYGKTRVTMNDRGFSIKCVGVFDTVGALGLPEELTFGHKAVETIFGFPDKKLGEHIENAFHALSINETRLDFVETKFEQSAAGRSKGQVLKQVWFSGVHVDIGGGYQDSDLSEITLAWMVQNIEPLLAIDSQYLKSLPRPAAPYGQLQPHAPATGLFSIAAKTIRQLPTSSHNNVTHESIHYSVLKQKNMTPAVQQSLKDDPLLVKPLDGLEAEFEAAWPYDASSPKAVAYEERIGVPSTKPDIFAKIGHVGEQLAHNIAAHMEPARSTQSGAPAYDPKAASGTPLKDFIDGLDREMKLQSTGKP